jgi:predicted transcriptional regulator
MVALPVFDAVLSSGLGPEKSGRVAGQLVRSALSELADIHVLEENVAPENPLAFERQTASSIRGMYESWVRGAEALLERVAVVERNSRAVEEAEALRDAVGRTRAMLSVSLDQVERGLRDIAEGHTVPAEEVRRELRLRAR